MTALVHPLRNPGGPRVRGRLSRRFTGARRQRPRDPCGHGRRRRDSAWDTMGYHGITWASMSCRGASPAARQTGSQALLRGCRLKEWLRLRLRLRFRLKAAHGGGSASTAPLWLRVLLASGARDLATSTHFVKTHLYAHALLVRRSYRLRAAQSECCIAFRAMYSRRVPRQANTGTCALPARCLSIEASAACLVIIFGG
jgi:hypothetical protein